MLKSIDIRRVPHHDLVIASASHESCIYGVYDASNTVASARQPCNRNSRTSYKQKYCTHGSIKAITLK